MFAIGAIVRFYRQVILSLIWTNFDIQIKFKFINKFSLRMNIQLKNGITWRVSDVYEL